MLRISLIIIALSLSTNAMAQVPDPFVTYDANAEKPAVAPVQPVTQVILPQNVTINPLYEVIRQGNWTLSGMSAFSYDSSTNELINGTDLENSTYLLRLDIGLGYNIFDRFRVDLVGGAMIRRLARETGASPANDWLIQGRGKYTIPMNGSVGLTGGLALGGYFGSSEREVVVAGEVINETTSTYGMATDTLLGLTYALNQHLALEMLGNFAWFWGKESIPSADTTLSASSTHVGLSLGLGYTF